MSERFVSLHSLRAGVEIPTLRDGVPSFLGVPIARSRQDLNGADAVVIGIPYDQGLAGLVLGGKAKRG